MSNSPQYARSDEIQQQASTSEMARELFANKYFSMTFWWHEGLIHLVELGPGKNRSCSGHSVTPYSDTIAGAMRLYQNRKRVNWLDPPLNWSLITSAFQKQVLQTLFKNISFGQTVSYGKLAGLSGNARAARAVGRAMSLNPWPIIVPCHRVLTGKGTIGGFSSGKELKKILLSLEGCLI